MNFDFDFKKFYLSADGRVNRQQWWLRLIVPVLVIELVLSFIDAAFGTYRRRDWWRGLGRAVRARGPDPGDHRLHQAVS